MVGRRARPAVRVARELEDGADDLAGKKLERRVVDVALPVVRLLSRDDPFGQEWIGERRQGAVEVGLAPGEGELVQVDRSGLQAQPACGTRAEVRGVDLEIVEKAAAERLRKGVVEGAQEESLAVVDLGPVHALVAGDVHPPVTDFEIQGNRLREQGRREGDRREGEECSPTNARDGRNHFSSWGERFDPCTATWQVVQLR